MKLPFPKILFVSSVLLAGCLQAAENLVPNGDFETGTPLNAFVREGMVLSLFEGTPVPGVKSDGNFCAELTLAPEGSMLGTNVRIPVDPTLKYRASIRIYTEASVTIRVIGCAFDDGGSVLPSQEQPWTYWLKTGDGKQQEMGPTSGWITLQSTLGPTGSGADYEWDPNTTWINMSAQFGEGEGKVYIDDRIIEQVEKF